MDVEPGFLGPFFKNFGFDLILAPGVVRNGFLSKFWYLYSYFHNFSMEFVKIVIFDRGNYYGIVVLA